MASWKEKSLSWRTMPLASSSRFFGGVFCLFASLILIGASMNPRSQSTGEMISGVFIGGGVAMLWAYAGTRRVVWLFLILGPLEAVAFSIQSSWIGVHSIPTD